MKLIQEVTPFKFDNPSYTEFNRKSKYITSFRDISTDTIRSMVRNVERHKEEQQERETRIKQLTE